MQPQPPPIIASVTIACPRAEVYRWYRDLTHLPQFLGDVTSVTPEGDDRYRWTVVGPLHLPVHWTVEVVDDEPSARIRYRTTPEHGLAGEWIVTFADAEQAGATVVTEEMRLPAQALSERLLALVGKPPQAELDANLQRLKERLETGHVTSTAHAVAGKFPSGGELGS